MVRENSHLKEIEGLNKRMDQIKAQRQAILNQHNIKDRKERTRRLIQMGAIIEKYSDTHTPEELKAWLDNLMESGKVKLILE